MLWCHLCFALAQPWCLIYCYEGQKNCLILKQSFISPRSPQHEIVLHIRRVVHILKQTQQGISFNIYSTTPSITKAISAYMEIWFSRDNTVNFLLHDVLARWPLPAPPRKAVQHICFCKYKQTKRDNCYIWPQRMFLLFSVFHSLQGGQLLLKQLSRAQDIKFPVSHHFHALWLCSAGQSCRTCSLGPYELHLLGKLLGSM